MAKSRARARIEARIHERVAYCIEFELNDPRASFVTVTGVEVSPDLSVATVLYSVYGSTSDRSKVAHMLDDATGFVRKQVGRVLRVRRIPRLRWIYDDSIELQANMERRIAEALQHDREVNPQAHEEVGSLEQDPTPEEELESEYREFLEDQDDAK